MCPGVNYPPGIHNDDTIGKLYGAQAMGDDERGAALGELLERGLNLELRLGVDLAGEVPVPRT